MDVRIGETSFTITGFRNWKDETVGLAKHKVSSDNKVDDITADTLVATIKHESVTAKMQRIVL